MGPTRGEERPWSNCSYGKWEAEGSGKNVLRSPQSKGHGSRDWTEVPEWMRGQEREYGDSIIGKTGPVLTMVIAESLATKEADLLSPTVKSCHSQPARKRGFESRLLAE